MKSFNKYLLTIIFLSPIVAFLITTTQSFNKLDSLQIGDSELTTSITKSYYVDEGQGAFLDQQLKELSLFDLPYKDFTGTLNWGFDNRTFYYKYEIENLSKEARSYVVHFDNPTIDRLSVFEVTNVQNVLLAEFGDTAKNVSQSNKAMPSVIVGVPSGQTKTLVFVSKTTGAAFLPVLIFLSDSFSEYQQFIYLIWGAFIGISVLMSLYNLILFAGANERIYLYYIGYVCFFLVQLGALHGFNAYIIGGELNQWLSKNINVLSCFVSFFSVKLALRFLKLDHLKDYIWVKVANIYSYTLAFFAFVFIFLEESTAASIFFFLLIAAYTIAIALMLYKFKERIKWTKYYIISWVPLFVGAGLGSLMFAGVSEYSFWNRHASLMGVLTEMVLISMALAERLRNSEAERLYQASHEPYYKLPNVNLLEQKGLELSTNNTNFDFSIVSVSINNYESLESYIPKDRLKEVVYKFLTDIEQRLSLDLQLVDFDSDSYLPNVAMLNDGVFSFLVSSSDQMLLSSALKKVSERQPIKMEIPELPLQLNFVVGASSFIDSPYGVTDVIYKAQLAVEQAKELNKNVWIFSQSEPEANNRKFRMASDIKLAMRSGEMFVKYQPQFDIDSGEIVTFEALLRWRHPELGDLNPLEVITVAEDTGLIEEVTIWLIEASCRNFSRFYSAEKNSELCIAINMSTQVILSPSFSQRVMDIIETHKLKASQFLLEITERSFKSDSQQLEHKIRKLRALGFKIAIDDFGTGSASLTYLNKGIFNALKIPKKFIQSMPGNERSQSIVRSCISLANQLEMDVVAEGVEREIELDLLKTMDCKSAQGFLLSYPLTVEEIEDQIEKGWKLNGVD
ncbi:hypothetical protein GCM10009128_01190 [Psychrosphaera haliotis]|uniref:EAL domain-containing protein n=1 Tax=Psychrosphaera haliotis TaxID=555083 RepID=UPI0031DF60E6